MSHFKMHRQLSRKEQSHLYVVISNIDLSYVQVCIEIVNYPPLKTVQKV